MSIGVGMRLMVEGLKGCGFYLSVGLEGMLFGGCGDVICLIRCCGVVVVCGRVVNFGRCFRLWMVGVGCVCLGSVMLLGGVCCGRLICLGLVVVMGVVGGWVVVSGVVFDVGIVDFEVLLFVMFCVVCV